MGVVTVSSSAARTPSGLKARNLTSASQLKRPVVLSFKSNETKPAALVSKRESIALPLETNKENRKTSRKVKKRPERVKAVSIDEVSPSILELDYSEAAAQLEKLYKRSPSTDVSDEEVKIRTVKRRQPRRKKSGEIEEAEKKHEVNLVMSQRKGKRLNLEKRIAMKMKKEGESVASIQDTKHCKNDDDEKIDKLVREYSSSTDLVSLDWKKMKIPPVLPSSEHAWLFKLMQPMKETLKVKETLQSDLERELTDDELAQAINMDGVQLRKQLEVGRAARYKLIKNCRQWINSYAVGLQPRTSELREHNLRLVLFVMKRYFQDFALRHRRWYYMRGSADVSPSSCSIPAFKPRQILLLQQQKQINHSASTQMAQLKPDDDSTLMFSVALWLQNKGFSKVLKRFLAAAEIQDDDWKSKALNLNEVFSKYQEISNSICKDLKFQEKQEEQVAVATDKTGVANGTISEEVAGKKKKKKSKDEPAVSKCGKPLEDTTMTEKINGSHENGSEDESYEVSKKSNGDKVPELAEDQSTKKPNEKKKKKSKLVSQSLDAEAAEDVVDESKKASKKRKRMASDEKENQSGQEVAIEESKSKKSKGLEEGTHVPPQTAFPGSNGRAGEQEKVDTLQIDNSSQKKSASKQPKSSEPKSLIAFQRVKIDEVEFVDERLQDNSYWAKDGAETGYGAKAQEVLGQVKGRGFRHEKTKKKRGSYRGGQIDLQSHSIKFKDSDEE